MKYHKYPAYKDSGIEWLGEVPAHWGMRRLSWLFTRKKETNYPDEELLSVYRDYGVIPKSSRSDNFNKPSDDLSAYQLVQIGDLVLNKMKTWQGSIAISQYKGIVSPAYYVASPAGDFSLRFMHYLLRSDVYIAQYLRYSGGIRPNQWDLDYNQFRIIEALLPPIDEQKIVAAFLDHETAKIDTLIAKQERLIALLQEKRQALISHVVTKGLNPDVPMKESGDELFGMVPMHWQIKRLKHVLREPLMYGASESGEADSPEDPRFIRITDIDEAGNLREETFRSLSPELAQPYLLSDGDVLFARSGATVGKAFIYRSALGKACFAGYLIRARLDMTTMVPQWLRYCSQANFYWQYITATQIQSTIQNVSAEKYAHLYLPCPPIQEQLEIIRFLENKLGVIDALISKAALIISSLQERRSALISAAVTGKIDVRNLVN